MSFDTLQKQFRLSDVCEFATSGISVSVSWDFYTADINILITLNV